MGRVEREWQDIETVLGYFGRGRKAIEKYEQFVREGIEESELRSGMRKKRVVKGQRMLCQLAAGKMGYPGAAVARFLGVTTSSVNRLAATEEMPDLRKYLKML